MTAAPSFTIADLAGRMNARLTGPGNLVITALAAIDEARPGGADLTFIADKTYAARWSESKAAAAVVTEGLEIAGDSRPLLAVKDVEQAMIALLELFLPSEDLPEIGVHPSAVVHPSAALGRDVRISAHVSIGPDATVGDGVTLHPGVRVYAQARIGEGSVLHANVVVRERCVIGRRVIIHQNSSIGADGFGYRPAPDGGGLLKMPHIGNAVIEDDVEIGANTCVDRAKFGSTLIGAGSKIDNLCQIAHNVRMGRSCVMAGSSGISGSSTVGDGCVIGGSVAISDHVILGDRVRVAGRSGVINDFPSGTTIAGQPATEARTAMRELAAIKRLPALLRQLSHLIDDSKPEKPPSRQ